MSESFSAAFKVYWPVVILCFVLVLVQLDFQASFFSQLEWKPVSYSTKTTNTPIYREQAWCPSAPISSCGFVHDHCNPCGRRWLIIVSMGRAASTTLMNQMWTLPQIHMGGENSGLFFNLNKAFDQTLTAKSFNETDRVAAWAHEPVSKELLSCSIQNALEAINPPQIPKKILFWASKPSGWKPAIPKNWNKSLTFYKNPFLVRNSSSIIGLPKK